MSQTKIIILIGLAALFVGGAAVYTTLGKAPAENTTEETKLYENLRHGFLLTYTADLDAKEYGAENVVFGNIRGESIEGVVEARVITVSPAQGESFIEAAGNDLKMLCAADGPDASFSCTGVERVAPISAQGGASGYSLYLLGEERTLSTNDTEAVSKGPYFVFPLQTSATQSKLLVIHPPLNQTADESDAEIIRAVATSLQLTGTQGADPIAEYIRDNISELAPEAAVLGGTFFVTDLDARDGKGTVEYEDGHNAYTADFTYTVDAQGNVTVDSFNAKRL